MKPFLPIDATSYRSLFPLTSVTSLYSTSITLNQNCKAQARRRRARWKRGKGWKRGKEWKREESKLSRSSWLSRGSKRSRLNRSKKSRRFSASRTRAATLIQNKMNLNPMIDLPAL